MPASALHGNLNDILAAQQRLPGLLSVLIGIGAGVVTLLPAIAATSQHMNTMAHEGGHALIASLSGRTVDSVDIHRKGGGVTGHTGPDGLSAFVTSLAGYAAPSLFGL